MNDYETFAQEYLDPGSTHGTEWAVRCPVHGDRHPSASYNVERGVFFCHACGAGGSTAWLADTIGVPWDSSFDTSVDRVVYEMRSRMRNLRKMTRRKKLPPPPRNTAVTGIDYWANRHIDVATMVDWGLGYDVWDDAMLIPARDVTGELLGTIRRYVGGESRYRYPKGMRIGHLLFGADKADERDGPMVLVEGSIDAILLHQHGWQACAVLGSRLTSHQIDVIRSLGVSDVILAFDWDTAGQEAARRARRDLADMVVTCQVLRNPVPDAKDPGECFDVGQGEELMRQMDRLAQGVGYTSRTVSGP